MSLYDGPPRPGARGGRDQFNWESVKSDKDREYYLGHSVKATTGRWQKGKDVFWYTREKGSGNEKAFLDEIAYVKQIEEEQMMEALGLKPKTVKSNLQRNLDSRDMKKLIEGDEEDEDNNNDDGEAVRKKGIGFTRDVYIGSGEAEIEHMKGIGVDNKSLHAPRSGNIHSINSIVHNSKVTKEKKLKKKKSSREKHHKKHKVYCIL